MRRRKRTKEVDLPEQKLAQPERKHIKTNAPQHAIKPAVRQELESQLDENLEDVRVHDNDHAHRKAFQLGAAAYSEGRDVYFSQGRYQPDTPEGKRLLAHEVVHIVQSRNSGSSSKTEIETEANEVADAVSSGGTRRVARTASPGRYLAEEEKADTKPQMSVHPVPIKPAHRSGSINVGTSSVMFEYLADEAAEQVTLQLQVSTGISLTASITGGEATIANAGGDKARTVKITAPSAEPSMAKVTFSAGSTIHIVRFQL